MPPRKPRRRSVAELEAECIVWNDKHHIGTPVLYHPVIGQAEGRPERTTSDAYVMGDHTAVIFISNQRGCVALDAIEPLEAFDAA